MTAITIITYFVVFTALCWFLDLAGPGKHQTQTRYGIFFDAGILTGILALVCSIVVRRSDPWLARVGFFAFFLWVVWALLPRL